METTPVILGMDTSLGPCSVALCRGEEVLAERTDDSRGKQSALLIPMIESLLAEAGLQYADCGAVASTIGPGGFTGIRTGLATMRAIALAIGKPAIGITTLETLAFGASRGAESVRGDVLSVIDAYREQWYVQRFRVTDAGATAQSPPMLVDEKGKKALAHGAKIIERSVSALDATLLASDLWAGGIREFPTTPLYLREPDAKRPLNEGLKCDGELL